MAKAAKRFKDVALPAGECALPEAIAAVAGGSGVKFDEMIDIALQLGVDTRKSDQSVRGVVGLPAGIGKEVRVAVVAQKEEAQKAALAAGAERAGFEDIIADISAGKLDFDLLIAAPDAMRALAPAAKVLGPRGLMPNPKNNTVAADVGEAVKSAKAGQTRYRADKAGIVHASVGRASFAPDDIKRNIETLLDSVKKAKPASAKGVYLRRLSLSATMGRAVRVDLSPYR